MAGFRLNPEEDGDIIKDLSRFRNRSKRIKELIRKGLKYENCLMPSAPEFLTEEELTVVKTMIPLAGIPPEDVPKPRKLGVSRLKDNILKNNF